MSVPVHSVKHLKSEYQRYQWIAVVSAVTTIIFVFIAAVTSIQVSRITKEREQKASQNQNRADETLARETDALRKQLADIERQLTIEKETNQQLQLKIVALQKQLAESKSTPHSGEEKNASPSTAAPAVTPPASDSKPVQGGKPFATPSPSTGDKASQQSASPAAKPAPEPLVKKPAAAEKPAQKTGSTSKPSAERATPHDTPAATIIPTGAESRVVEQEKKIVSEPPPQTLTPAASPAAELPTAAPKETPPKTAPPVEGAQAVPTE
jgi:regulator of replication initiation timing